MFEGLENLAAVLIASVFLIFLGLVYFMVNLWIVKTGSNLLGLTAELPVLSAALLTFAGVISSALSSRR